MQASCCCGDLNISVKYVFAFDGVLDTAEYSFTSCMHCYCHWSSSITTLGLHKDLFPRKTKQIQAHQVQNAAPTGDRANFASLLQSARFVYISCFWLLFANRYLVLLQLQSTA